MTTTLSKQHQQTYDALFAHPQTHNLHRRDVNALLSALAEVTEEPNGNLKATRNGQTLVLHASRDKNVAAMDELKLIRTFLESSQTPEAQVPPDAGHYLVVIDHREARLYKTELHGTTPQRITPVDPQGFGRHLRHVEDDATGQRMPENKNFYAAVAQALRAATKILLFGSGTGAGSAMDHLLADLQAHHPDIAARVIGSITLDVQHLSEDQLLAKAREFYEKPAPAISEK